MDYENWNPPRGQLEIVKFPDGTARVMRCVNGVPVANNQPERSKREDINYPKFECKRCKFAAIQYRKALDGKITCPECHEINDAVL